MNEPATNGVELAADIRRRDDAIELRYAVVNHGPASLAVLNAIRTSGADGVWSFHPDTAYVSLAGESVVVTKGALPIPEGLFPSNLETPYAHLLAAGETLTESFVLRLPLPVCDPFAKLRLKGDVSASNLVTAKSMTFRVGVVPIGGDARALADLPAHPGLRSIYPPRFAREGQTLLEKSFALDADIAVLDYQVFPWPK